MNTRSTPYDKLCSEYSQRFSRSAERHAQARQIMVDGGQHTLRLYQPFPVHIQSASGAYVTDYDGHQILDFWQGHFANLLGHNPPQVTAPLAEMLSAGYGLQTGMVDDLESLFEGDFTLPEPEPPSRAEIEERLHFLEELRREGTIGERAYIEKKRQLDRLYNNAPN